MRLHQKRGTLRIDLTPDAILFLSQHWITLDGKAEKYFHLLDGFCCRRFSRLWEDFNAKFIRKLIQILRMVRVATPKKKTTDQTVATICQGALCGAAVTMAAVQSAVRLMTF